ncbi:inositol monophosphatase family protein [Asaia krungthepensis]|uniref:Inositol monophosphatase n=1 Tax=Asaia krungthepensis NRIC 0535 TaxID=1307925 RepID=A0ABQ0Q1A9_9PROT|nr:inositol monophosphatase [Asaia krungthepensis]GBQ86691.1 inositol monophosphatase [Asaia krungthepensis NRIC 0535]
MIKGEDITVNEPPSVIDRRLLEDLANIARDAATRIIMPRFGRLSEGEIRTKTSPSDLVTVADLLAEEFIANRIRRLLPDALLVGEERCSAHPHLIDEAGKAPLAVTIDPIDGTANYAAGLPVFGVMLAVLDRGIPVASVIHDPVTGSCALALRGEGAWLEDDTGSITPLRAASPFASIREVTGKIAWRTLPLGDTALADHNLRSMTGLWDLRCAAHEYRMVASGHGHVLAYSRTCLWDHCPGWLLMHEAGSYGARLNGAPYHAAVPGRGLLYAPDRNSWEMIHQALALSS